MNSPLFFFLNGSIPCFSKPLFLLSLGLPLLEFLALFSGVLDEGSLPFALSFFFAVFFPVPAFSFSYGPPPDILFPYIPPPPVIPFLLSRQRFSEGNRFFVFFTPFLSHFPSPVRFSRSPSRFCPTSTFFQPPFLAPFFGGLVSTS